MVTKLTLKGIDRREPQREYGNNVAVHHKPVVKSAFRPTGQKVDFPRFICVKRMNFGEL